MKKATLMSILLLAGAIVPTACNRQAISQPQSSEYNEDDFETWRGPGMYHGVYFSNEARYGTWRRQNRRTYRRHDRRRQGGSSHRGGSGQRRGGRGRR